MFLPGILVMAKAPVPGRVKTRLCPPCTPADAAAIARAALCDTLDAAQATGRRVVLALDGEPGRWLPRGVDVVAQAEGTFSERLAAAWTHLPRGGVQIGMDTPQVTAELLDRATDAVASCGSTLGLAHDGGWWLIGITRPDPRVFVDIAMSTPTTGHHQLRRLHELGYSPALMPLLTDIDMWPDACAVGATIPGTRTSDAVDRVTARGASVVMAR